MGYQSKNYTVLGTCLLVALALCATSAVVLMGKIKLKPANSDVQNGDCVLCLNQKDTLSIEVSNRSSIDGFRCEIQDLTLDSIIVEDRYGNQCINAFDSTNARVFQKINGRNGNRMNVEPPYPPFSLGEFFIADIFLYTDCPNLIYNGEVGTVKIFLSYLDCEGKNMVDGDEFEYEIGCPTFVDDEAIFTNHSTSPVGTEQLLPYYTLGEFSVTLSSNVSIKANDEAYFRTCPDGFIRVEKEEGAPTGGVKAEKGSFFKAERIEAK